ncbi:oxygen-independent coproporphyrinogen III oxidase [Methylopila sp. Yamaguchi]|uniref:oxygen-independent coproporphyrinogen III oxidase n=1 Tax=Methylopila sp. Yamaguchi TaxID=1437817 RepID=UPI000CBDE6E7|nr:oxygen-independent coproporphyrinogen III oxidase [Methylopila sp. Yamaguchi]GBD47931.1 oxygen-independent coproporphyrinogen III oxidase [Methylopila sp. Yamaguchi]
MLPLRLTDLADRQVPRYTSYPTAPQFHDGVGAEDYSRWLGALREADAPVSLYLHVPYCRSICHYCACTTKATRRDEPVLAYARRLTREISLVAERTGRLRVSHIHWGGGTPNLLPPDLFDALVADLCDRFDVDPYAEHAIELDPRHVTRESARRLAASGVTRASLGVQDFAPEVQSAIGRIQPHRVVAAAAEAVRAAGIEGLNFDLIYGLPRQTLRSVRETALRAVALAPDRIALFGYAHVPWFRANQRLIDAKDLPDVELRLELAATAREAIEAAGYVPVGIDHFARSDDSLATAAAWGTLRRNFQGYTTDRAETLIGLGPSSVGRLPEGYVQNAADVGAWARAIDDGRLAVAKGRALTPDDRLRGAVIERLLCSFEADLGAIAMAHGASPAALLPALERLEPLIAQDFVRLEGSRLSIVRDAPALARIVASAFDAYLGAGARHSLAA